MKQLALFDRLAEDARDRIARHLRAVRTERAHRRRMAEELSLLEGYQHLKAKPQAWWDSLTREHWHLSEAKATAVDQVGFGEACDKLLTEIDSEIENETLEETVSPRARSTETRRIPNQ